ncbi:hypothetical protein OSTOST_18128 [Ostertagia ostertagi]
MIWMSQVISAVYYMHTRGIVHRDLKLENIVIFPDEGIIKISDFGFARSVIRGDALSETYCGSKSYSAPEILKGEPYDPYKSDVWSVGVIAFVIVTDCMPYCEKRQIHKLWKHRDFERMNIPLNYISQPSVASQLTP